MNKLIEYFKNNISSLIMFVYLINIILIALLYNNPIISLVILLALVGMSWLTRRGKFLAYFKFSISIFIITMAFNLIINQRGQDVLLRLPFIVISTASLVNAITLGLSFVNLLWTFYLYDAFVKTKVIFEILSYFFKSIAIIFMLTIKFIPRIVGIFKESKNLRRFRSNQINQKLNLLNKIRQTIDLNETVLDKAMASFMGVSDTLVLKGYEKRSKKVGHFIFNANDWSILLIIIFSLIFNISMSALDKGKIDFGSGNLQVSFGKNDWWIIIVNIIIILLPLLTGGVHYLWWKFYGAKTTVSNTTTAKNYR
ncbi:hypothetical protein [Companilactobacillus halodurans]|uniref:Energy-coupling factor transporter transmembrane protein EcfT n=1 Tax=Companilactobacillus halodurans TaxID=2584183 RepID=A0A5P0ZR23_9LACO|nr:hypothetical protein [Companilactobacillus halodurans]MQS76331.1 hypothetical protein [Companilactobacillus halodurans]MQS98185.1 hypothetical protein [Companilactobacillus halodurans]